MSKSPEWFSVDKAGLSKLIERKGPGFVLFELLQNAWDLPGAKEVQVRIYPVSTESMVEVEDDDPAGFTDLNHAFTLFAPSAKKADPLSRGRFNLGEKLALAVAKEALISSTGGTLVFDRKGRRRLPRRREAGTLVRLSLPWRSFPVADLVEVARRCIPPQGIRTVINGVALVPPTVDASFSAKLMTVFADGDGVLRKGVRSTKVEVYKADGEDGRPGWLYEMGIPVCETGDPYHYNVLQKIPLGFDRDEVSPSYLAAVRAGALNVVAATVRPEEAHAPWIRDAIDHPAADAKAVALVVKQRFGDKAVAHDPSDLEANKRAAAAGYTVVSGGSLPGGA